jgi:integrase/recombinase XerD
MPDQPLFLSRKGSRLSLSQAKQMFRDTALRAGIINPNEHGVITWHKLRHTFATRMMDCIGIFRVQKMLGHRSLVTTERYLHADLEDLRSAYDRASPRLSLNAEQESKKVY